MKKNYFMEVLVCGLMTLVLNPIYLTAVVGGVEGTYTKMSIDDIDTCNALRNENDPKHKHSHSRRGPPGPTGATGPAGPTGATGSLASSFISYYSNEVQLVPPSTSAFLAFTTSQTTTGTIIPSASGSAPVSTVDTFTVTTPGVYLVTWNVAINTGNNVNATLDLLINGTAINSPFESLGYGGGGGGSITSAVSGSFLVNLDANDTIQLQVSAFVGEVSANSPSISILKVAEIPPI